MDDFIDELIADAVIYGEVSTGAPLSWMAARGYDAKAIISHAAGYTPAKRAGWTDEEEEYLRHNLGWLSEQQMADHLGRTVEGIHIHWEREMRLPAPTRHPDWMPCNQVAIALGIPCVKTITGWIEKFKFLPGRPLPANRKIVVVHRQDLIRFVVNPKNWLYFKTERVRDPYIKALIERQRKRWNDDWWTVGQVAAYHGVSLSHINNQIRRGTIPAVDYGNWHVLRSVATDPRLKFFRGKGAAETIPWSDSVDGWILLARAVGLSFPVISKLCAWEKNRADVRLRRMSKDEIELAIQRTKAKVQYNRETGVLWVDWRQCAHRFPSLVRAIERFHAGLPLTEAHRNLLSGVLWSWAQWHADTPERARYAKRLTWHNVVTRDTIQRILDELRAWGLDVF